ncbi:hypothetical protein L6164_006419 [Bauhinia variegata]|uniref:Uncharacterized protein n=1 Tax=Bauhinia variegata TaxID=167791 RepID=A0ACB9PTV5_BAUVA|nr:hypothetical protein L6164_006419 [Bauhinia variegata]
MILFHVFFNDHVGNDFNTLFKSFPVEKKYYAAGVPGSFHGRLFPKSSLHFIHSSYALQWLSRVPREILDKDSSAFNKGKIYITNAPKEVAQAYSAQFAQDLAWFLNFRALELVPGGLMALLIPCRPLNCKNKLAAALDMLEDILLGMACKFKGINLAKQILKKAILDHFDIGTLHLDSSHALNIADLGCSIGPNTFFVVENIIEFIYLKFQSSGYDFDKFEFNVFFNDHVSNDFNTLFKSFPVEKKYYAAGVPGSFHGRLFPKSSLHFVHSSYALQWLSRVPKEILDKDSRAFNKGKIYFTTAPKEVALAYSAQFAEDMACFLNSRAVELVPGGLVALLIPCMPLNSKNTTAASIDVLGDILMDLASKGKISDELVNSFNMPLYFPTTEEVKLLIETNGNFSIEIMEPIVWPQAVININANFLHMRAGWERLVRQHFGGDIVDEVFEQFQNKMEESSIWKDSSYDHLKELFVVVKMKFV